MPISRKGLCSGICSVPQIRQEIWPWWSLFLPVPPPSHPWSLTLRTGILFSLLHLRVCSQGAWTGLYGCALTSTLFKNPVNSLPKFKTWTIPRNNWDFQSFSCCPFLPPQATSFTDSNSWLELRTRRPLTELSAPRLLPITVGPTGTRLLNSSPSLWAPREQGCSTLDAQWTELGGFTNSRTP